MRVAAFALMISLIASLTVLVPAVAQQRDEGIQSYNQETGILSYHGSTPELAQIALRITAIAQACLAGTRANRGEIITLQNTINTLAIPGKASKLDFEFLADAMTLAWSINRWC